MRFNFIAFLITAGICSSALSQIGMGNWRLHTPSIDAVGTVVLGESSYTAFQSSVVEYHIPTNEISVWDRVNGLSDITISSISIHNSSNSVFVGYQNGNIDQISNNTVFNIPGLLLASVQGDKQINVFQSHGAFIYAATGIGILVVNPSKHEIKDTYYPASNQQILDVAFVGDTIFALTDKQLYKANINNPALADPSQWQLVSQVPILTVTDQHYTDIQSLNNELFLLKQYEVFGSDTIYKIGAGMSSYGGLGFDAELLGLDVVKSKLTVIGAGFCVLYNADASYHVVINDYLNNLEPSIAGVAYDASEDRYYLADKKQGLVRRINEYGYQVLFKEGPPTNLYYRLDWLNGNLALSPGANNGRHVRFNPAGCYVMNSSGDWMDFTRYNQPLWENKPIWDNIGISFNPRNKNQLATGSFSDIPLSLLDIESGLVTDTFTVHNSPLELTSEGNIFSFISDVEYDDDGNLWVLNSMALKPLKMYSAAGDWYEFTTPSASSNKLAEHMEVDYNGNIWFAVKDNGLFGYNPGSNKTDPSDDKVINLRLGVGLGNLPSNEVTAIGVDFDNEIWIGTDAGFAILYNSAGAFDASAGGYDASRLKLEFEGNVEYVLGNTSITDFEIDGGNRKWVGTANSGVILLSADGLEIIRQFTTDNSPLISDVIVDIEIDHKTGEVFIITDKGLISYRSDASYEDPEYSDVQVFPNPLLPGMTEPVTIQGIRYDSDVRVTDVSGNLIYKTTSNGGTATWNGRNLNGERVASGVYLIWTAPNVNKGRYVGKVLVIN